MGVIRNAAILLGGLYVTAYAHRSYTVDLRHFAPSEFGAWWPRMSVRLLEAMDEFREQLGVPLEVSPAVGSLGRTDGSSSQHNVAKWGEVRAADVLVPEGMTLRQAYEVARRAELFSGIGVYPDWHPRAGLHLDVRTTRSPQSPALWSGRTVNGRQVYAALEYGFTDRIPPGFA